MVDNFESAQNMLNFGFRCDSSCKDKPFIELKSRAISLMENSTWNGAICSRKMSKCLIRNSSASRDVWKEWEIAMVTAPKHKYISLLVRLKLVVSLLHKCWCLLSIIQSKYVWKECQNSYDHNPKHKYISLLVWLKLFISHLNLWSYDYGPNALFPAPCCPS